MKIQGNNKFIKFYNIHNKTDKTKEEKDELYQARKEDPILDRALYEADKAKIFQELSKLEQIARKIAKGEALTAEERAYIQERDPERLRKAEEAKQRAEEVARQVKNAKSPMEKSQVISASLIEAQEAIKGGDTIYAELLSEALGEALNKLDEIDLENSINKNNLKEIFNKKYLKGIDINA